MAKIAKIEVCIILTNMTIEWTTTLFIKKKTNVFEIIKKVYIFK